MPRPTILAALAACLCASVALAEPDNRKPPAVCETLEQSRASAAKIADDGGLDMLVLDGPQAEMFLGILNQVEPQTSYSSRHVGIMPVPAKGAALILVADGPCGGYQSWFRIKLKIYEDAYRAARGDPA